MEHLQENELSRIKELLRHIGEFIAYFELAEAKMIEWREEMEQQAARLNQHSQRLQNELTTLDDLLSQAGTTRFRIIVERALSQGETQLQLIENSCNQFTENFQEQQDQLELLTTQCITKIEQHCSKATQVIANQLAQYDVHQFHRIANESCDHVERVANDAVHKSNKLLHMFEMRFGLFAILTTIITTFFMALYLNGELPWEMHHKAMNERHAGKALLQAWPKLTLEEKTKIINDDDLQHGG